MKFSLVSVTTLACLHSGLCAEDGLVLLQTQVQTAEESHAIQSLFPGLASLKDPRQNRAALAQIQRTVSSLAKDSSQITPAVTSLLSTVIETLRTTFQPIESDHDIDQSDLSSKHTDFNNINLGVSEDDGTAVGAAVDAFDECIQAEDGLCIEVGLCAVDAGLDNEAYKAAEDNLMNKDSTVDHYWCGISTDVLTVAPKNVDDRKAEAVREVSANNFQAYIDALHNLTELSGNITDCGPDRKLWVDQMDQCNGYRTEAHHASCNHYDSVNLVNSNYETDFHNKVVELQDLTASVRLREADRKVEWDVLTRTICLLSSLVANRDSDGTLIAGVDATPIDGSLADAATQQAISDCSSVPVDTSTVTVNYPYQPDISAFQNLPDHPCSTEFSELLTTFETQCTHSIAADQCVAPFEMTCSSCEDDTCHVLKQEDSCAATCVTALPPSPTSPDLATTYFILVDPVTTAQLGNFDNLGWKATLDGTEISGSASVLYDNSRFGFFHGSPTLNANYATAPPGTETTEDALFRVGGFYYQGEAGATPTLKMIAPASHGNSTHALSFSYPKRDLQQAPSCHGEFQPAPVDSWVPEGAMNYCFQVDASFPCCETGCFIYQFETTGYTCYPISVGLGLSMAD